MSINRWASRVDPNQAAIVAAMQAAGASVEIIKRPCDLLVGVAGQTALVEVKMIVGKRAPKAAGYTKAQLRFFESWLGRPVETITTPEQAVALVNAMKSELVPW